MKIVKILGVLAVAFVIFSIWLVGGIEQKMVDCALKRTKEQVGTADAATALLNAKYLCISECQTGKWDGSGKTCEKIFKDIGPRFAEEMKKL